VGAGAQVTAVEPDRDMAAWLVDSLPRRDVQVIVAPLEDADVAPSGFDVAVAATSFHWVHPASGLHKLRRALRPGSWLAIWWMLFEDPSAPDEFDGAAQAVLGGSPSASEPGRPPFQLDEPARLDELRRAGFVQATSDILRSRHQLNPAQIVALYSTMAILLRRPHDEQVKLLDALEGLVANQFEGEVTRTFVTALYTARAPSASGA
jgi:SAM-dependent methyltransferase